MRRWTIPLRGLTYYWRTNVAAAVAAAVATAALTGSLIIGDSVRGSLRAITLERLGSVDCALTAPRMFQVGLAGRIRTRLNENGGTTELRAALRLSTALVDAASDRRASRVTLLGVTPDFWEIAPGGPNAHPGPGQVVLNSVLADELGVAAGDSVLLMLEHAGDVPGDLALARRTDTVRTLGVEVVAVIGNRGVGRFSLAPDQRLPRNAYVDLSWLGRRLGKSDRANYLLASQSGQADGQAAIARLAAAINAHLQLTDLGLKVIVDRQRRIVQLVSEEMVLPPVVGDAAVAVVEERYPLMSWRILTHLANTIRVGDREIPYSTVVGIGEGDEDRLFLNQWAASDLNAKVGDRVSVSFYASETDEGRLVERTESFMLAGVRPLREPQGDRLLTPEYPGVTDAKRIGDWDPPFPVDLKRIRPIDEEYWGKYRATPKAYVSWAAARRLWGSRYGDLTAVRIDVPASRDLDAVAKEFRRALLAKLSPARFGLVFRPVREEGLAASAGNTNFAEYFFYFSFFLIVSALMLVGMLFRLGVEHRASQMGLLLATGWRVASVRRLLLVEGAATAGLGALLGGAGAVGYAWLILVGLGRWFAVIEPGDLQLHVAAGPVAAGAAAGFLAGLAAIFLTVRRVVGVEPRSLLAGRIAPAANTTGVSSRRGRWAAAVVLLAAAIVLVSISGPNRAIPQAAGFFGGGSLLLTAALVGLSAWLSGPVRARVARGRAAYFRLALRNAGRNPGRSVLTVGLVACALFVIVSVEAFRQRGPGDTSDRGGGSGGFTLIARSDLPVPYNPADAASHDDLNIGAAAAATMKDARIFPLRLRDGDEASCLTLYRPLSPRILGVPEALAERGGFRFAAGGDRDNPWELLDAPIEDSDGDVPVVPALADAGSAQYILHLPVGGELTILDEAGGPVRLRLVGTLSHSIFQSELLISEESFRKLFPRQSGYRSFLIDAPPAQTEAVSDALESSLADFGLDVTPTADWLSAYAQVENTYLSTFQALGALGLLLGTFGLAAVLLRNVMQRRSELALLRAVGFRRSALGGLVLAETVLLLLLGLFIGTASAMVTIIPHLADRAHVPLDSLVVVLAAVSAAGVGSGGVAVAAALRTPLLPALRAE